VNDPETLTSAEERKGERIWVQVLTRTRWHPAVIVGMYDVPDLVSPIVHFKTIHFESIHYDNFSKSKDYYYEKDSIVIRPRT
jgi:hypothetical protein